VEGEGGAKSPKEREGGGGGGGEECSSRAFIALRRMHCSQRGRKRAQELTHLINEENPDTIWGFAGPW